ncbi:unnamed protein product, partial [Meganyctiphanes norvegica]
LHEVVLLQMARNSGGNYRCEVLTEGPKFGTDVKGTNLTIIDTPDGPPVVRGMQPSYRRGDFILLNCTSHRSLPPPHLSWAIQADKQENWQSVSPTLSDNHMNDTDLEMVHGADQRRLLFVQVSDKYIQEYPSQEFVVTPDG